MKSDELSLPEEKTGASVAAHFNDTGLKLSVLEKVGYSLGDLAANLVFQTLVTYLAYFYTDIYGLKTEHASILILAVGLVAAFGFNPIIGALGRTQQPLILSFCCSNVRAIFCTGFYVGNN